MIRRIATLTILLWMLSGAGWTYAQHSDTSHLPGRIAYIGADHNVYTLNFAAQRTYQLTDNATNQVRYQWPTWSMDGRLAYFCCDLQTAADFETAGYIADDGTQPGKSVYSGYAAPVIYAAWSPQRCAESAKCLDLALLINNSSGLRVDIVRDKGDDATITTIAQGSPFYYGWSPDGAQLAFHRNNRTLDIYDVVSGRVITTSETAAPGTFQAPAWSPVDDRILSGARGETGTNLIITAQGENQTLIPEVNGTVSFNWSPDGNYVAYRLINNDNFGALFVVDALSGEVISRSSTSGVISFFWSPDSRKIAYVTFSESGGLNANAQAQAAEWVSTNPDMVQNVTGLAWSTLDVETGLNRRYSTFVPTNQAVYLLVYFDQFAPSHRIWSPDSNYIVYSEITRVAGEARPIVSVLNVMQTNSVPLTVADGAFAVWSFE